MSYNAEVEHLFATLPAAGSLPCGPGVFTASAGSVAGGVCVEFSLRLDDARIGEVRFRAYGCPHTLAAAARIASDLEGLALEAAAVDVQALASQLEVPAWKLGRLLVVQDALEAVVAAAKGSEQGDSADNGDQSD